MQATTLLFISLAAALALKSTMGDAIFKTQKTWPSGSYGLPMAQTGCPSSREFNWKIGYRFQDLDASFKSAEFHLAAHVAAGDVNQFFCIKNSGASDKSVPVWPSGDYCIYQRGAKCPATSGTFEAGYVLWDDENGANGNQNKNNKGGALPAGIYNNDTLMRFCCQVNGSVDDPIVLPVDDPFYLMVYKGNCQEVLGTIRIPENTCYDTEDTDNHDAVEAPYPLRAVRKTPCIDFCYYQPCRWRLSGLKGSFTSPGFPNPLKNRANCEWLIAVPDNHVIEVKFTSISLRLLCGSKCTCDYIQVSQVEDNSVIRLLARYCAPYYANHPPPVRSQTSFVVVYFRSYSVFSGRGFTATYTAFRINGSAGTPTMPVTTNSSLHTTTTKTTCENCSTDYAVTSKRTTWTVEPSEVSTGTIRPSELRPTNYTGNATRVIVNKASRDSECLSVLFVTVVAASAGLLALSCLLIGLWLYMRRLKREKSKPYLATWSVRYDARGDTVRLGSSSSTLQLSIDMYGYQSYTTTTNNNNTNDIDADREREMTDDQKLQLCSSEKQHLQEHKRCENVLYERSVGNIVEVKTTKSGEKHIYEGIS